MVNLKNLEQELTKEISENLSCARINRLMILKFVVLIQFVQEKCFGSQYRLLICTLTVISHVPLM